MLAAQTSHLTLFADRVCKPCQVRHTMVDAVHAVLSDIDGTLVDNNWLHASAWKDAFAVIDINLSLEDVRRQIGKGGDELIPVFVPWWKRKAVEQPLKKYREYIFRTEYLPQVKPFPHVRELLQRIKNRISRLLWRLPHISRICRTIRKSCTSTTWSTQALRPTAPAGRDPIPISSKPRWKS